jgi:hypothetical protein
MTSPKSVELKLGAKEPSMEEAKRCELKLNVEIKRTAHIRCGGRVPTGAIASRYPVKEEKIPTPVQRSTRIRGMKRKDYKEVLLSYGPPWAHYLGGYQDRLLGGPLGLPDLRYTVPDGVKHKDYRGEVLG